MLWPNGSKTAPVETSPYGKRSPIRLPDGSLTRPFHTGWDTVGYDSVCSILPGRIETFGYSDWAGWNVLVNHDNGFMSFYAHGERSPSFFIGERVREGQHLMHMGATGSATGKHLHLEVHRGSFNRGVGANPGNTIDPKQFIMDGMHNSVTVKPNGEKMLYWAEIDGKPVWAIAGTSPGTPANWLETYDQTFANEMAAQTGKAAKLSPASWRAWRAAYLAPVTTK